ncbi:hypothetical protein PENTCL1PPCAC_23814, partial [Pristionchus entomophagus]
RRPRPRASDSFSNSFDAIGSTSPCIAICTLRPSSPLSTSLQLASPLLSICEYSSINSRPKTRWPSVATTTEIS